MRVLFRVAKEAKKYAGLLILAAVSTLALAAVNLLTPRLMSMMVSMVSAGLEEGHLQKIMYISLALMGLYLSRILFRYLSNFMAHKAAWLLVEELRMRVYHKLQALPIEYFRNHQSGDLVSRTINDTASFELLYAHLLPESVTNLITVIGVIAILLTINTRLALLTCIPIPFILCSGWILSKKVRPNFREMQRSRGVLSAQLQDNFAGIQEIQIFGQQEQASEKVYNKASGFTKAMLKALNLNAVFHPSVEFLTSLGTVIVVGYGGYLAYLGQVDAADIVAFMLYLSLFYAPITGLANLMENMQEALAGAERVIEVLDAPQTVANNPNSKPLENCKGAVRFENVNFSYVENVPILKDINIDIKPGNMIALVGPTGVGKTTLTQLVARFYDPVSGAIYLDDQNLKDIELDSLHQNVSMVLQDTFLFNGTIAENIAFARPDSSMEEIEKVANIARIHDDIVAMADGYNTQVGERGAKLSGGQKQRIAIARAILCEAPILILDEATASVDVQTEYNIQQAISDLAGTRTIIAIAHRLSTIQRADRIYVFQDGKIIQSGTHDELIKKRGMYQEMWKIQKEGARIASNMIEME